MAGWTLVKIALLSDCYPPRLGGIETQVRDLAHHLSAAGHEVEVFTATTGPHGERGGAISTEDGVRVHRLAIRVPFGAPVNPFAPPEVRRRLAGGHFDVAHAHLGVVSPFATDLVPVALDLGLPVAATFHCVIDRSAPAFRLVGHIGRWADRGVALSAVSSMAAARVAAVAGDASVEVVGNGIDVALWRPTGVRRPDRHAVHVVSAMRLASRKRPIAALQVLRGARAILDPSVALTATIVGDGPQRAAMERHLRRHAMDWVSLPGRVDRATLRDLHRDADIFLNAARLEAFGIAALEARTAGVPVVALRGTGVEDFVTDGVDGLLADSDIMLAGALAHLAADAPLRQRMRAHLLDTPPEQDWVDVVRATLAQYVRAGAPRP